MRVLIGAFLFFITIMPVHFVSAVFYNNSETIEIGDGELPELPVESGGSGGGTSGASAGSSSAGASTGGSAGGGSGGSFPSSTEETSDNEETGTGGTDSGNETADQKLISILSESGALLGGMSGGAGVSSSGGAAGSGAVSVRIIGSKVREAFQNNFDLKELLQYWKRGKGAPGANEYGLIAASTAIRDSNVQEVSFTASKFEIVYRSRGYLLAVIPWSFPVRVGVVPEATALNDRVTIKLPWYSFFVRKFFTINGLKGDIDEVVEKTKLDAQGASDGTALVFEAVATFLKKKVGTVSDSVVLGVTPK